MKRENQRVRVTVYSLVLLSVLADVVLGQAPTLRRVPQSYAAIQSAIDASRPGDTVLVDHGVYFENIRLNKNIVLASRYVLDVDTAHIIETIIDGSRPRDSLNASTVTIGSADTTCVLMGFTIRGGIGTFHHAQAGRYNWISGGGVFVLNSGGRITHNRIVRNSLSTRYKHNRTFGAGIASHDTTFGGMPPPFLIIEDNVVSENVAQGLYGSSGGVEIGQPGVVRRNVITNNSAQSEGRSLGGGILVEVQSDYTVTLEGNYISGNTATWGGGILIGCGTRRQGKAVLSTNIIVHNTAYEVGGGIHIVDRVRAVVLANTIADNTALSQGGGIAILGDTDVAVVNNIIWGNSVDQIYRRHPLRAYHNIVQGGFGGIGIIDADPRFLPEDSLYHVFPNSPCLGSGIAAVKINGELVMMPRSDYGARRRKSAGGGMPDLGAVESPWPEEADLRADNAMELADPARHLKLTVRFTQRTGSEFSGDSAYVLRAGKIEAETFVNDHVPGVLLSPRELELTLSPTDNFLELEISGRGLDGKKPLLCAFKLEGRDEVVNVLSDSIDSDYHNYSDLVPGTYRLQLLPYDQERFFDVSNQASIAIIVLPYWYTRWWAYGLYAIAVITVAALIVRSRVKRLQLQQQLMVQHLQAEKLSEMDKLKSRFFANVSHELRTPLSLILGPADQLESAEDDPKQREQLNLVRQNAKRLLRMVDQLLQFSRLEAGNISLAVSLQPIPTLLKRVLSSFSTAALKKKVSLGIDIEPPSFEGYIDAEKVAHICENLLSNAIKYTPAGGRVHVRAERVGTDLIVSVSDTGVGISAEHLGKVFERFYRVDSSHQIEGTGIGLALVKEFTELHHGSIVLTSTPGGGTVATVRIPISGYSASEMARTEEIVDVEDRPPLTTYTPVTHSSPDEPGKTVVLVVEDNDDARAYLRSRLEAEFNVWEAAEGKDALDQARERVPDIVVSDVMMPGMNGYELCRMLKSDIRTSHIPVVLLTALADRTDRIGGLETGADDYLVKPFDAQELVVRIRNLIATRRLLQERFTLHTTIASSQVEAESLDETFVRKCVETVIARCGDSAFDVEQFAEGVYLGRAQLHRKLKALTGHSPTDFIRILRLQRAKELLEKKAGTIAEIADSVGFANHSYFAKCFQEQFGALPSEMMRQRENGKPNHP